MNREWEAAEHAAAYLERADRVPHRSAGETTLVDEIPAIVHRVLDLGSGDGRLLDLVLRARPDARGVALDFSPPMLEQLNIRFASSPRVEIANHDLERPLPDLGTFDAVVSSVSIHHVPHQRKRLRYVNDWDVAEAGVRIVNPQP